MDGLKVVQPGLLTTIQDLGRFGYLRFGLSATGPMDDHAFRWANLLVGNKPGEAALEMAFFGPELEALSDLTVALTGADMQPKVDGKPIPMWTSFTLKKGQVLSLSGSREGLYAYLAVAGGIDVPTVLGSKATDILGRIGGLEGRPLRKGDVLRIGSPGFLKQYKIPGNLIPKYEKEVRLRVVLGPQDDYFGEEGMKAFLEGQYVVTNQTDRMGARLQGPPIKHKQATEIISEGMMLGAIQVPPNGQPIILFAGRQTIGGYTKIATVISSDIRLAAQAKPGSLVSFEAVSIEEAQGLLREYESQFNTSI